MQRSIFVKQLGMGVLGTGTFGLSGLSKALDETKNKGQTLPVLFTSHGNPIDIPVPAYGNPFFELPG